MPVNIPFSFVQLQFLVKLCFAILQGQAFEKNWYVFRRVAFFSWSVVCCVVLSRINVQVDLF